MHHLSSNRSSRTPAPGIARDLHQFSQRLSASMLKELSTASKAGTALNADTCATWLPDLLEKHFVQVTVSEESAPQNRALLVHALSALTRQSLEDQDNRQSPPASKHQTPAASVEPDGVLTSAQAASLLNVSRTYLNSLVETGKLGVVERTQGGHRRIFKAVLMRYKAQSLAKQQQALAAMAQASEDMGLYDDELAGIPAHIGK